jgi:hypothetical protein
MAYAPQPWSGEAKCKRCKAVYGTFTEESFTRELLYREIWQTHRLKLDQRIFFNCKTADCGGKPYLDMPKYRWARTAAGSAVNIPLVRNKAVAALCKVLRYSCVGHSVPKKQVDEVLREELEKLVKGSGRYYMCYPPESS